jgi:hypothetical protein
MGSRGEDADRRKRGKCGRGTGEVDWIIGERRVRKVSRETTALGAELEKRKGRGSGEKGEVTSRAEKVVSEQEVRGMVESIGGVSGGRDRGGGEEGAGAGARGRRRGFEESGHTHARGGGVGIGRRGAEGGRKRARFDTVWGR